MGSAQASERDGKQIGVRQRHLRRLLFFFQAEDGIRDLTVTGVQSVLFRSPFPDVRAENSLPPVAMRNSSTTPMNATGVPSANGQRPDEGAVKSRNTLPQIGTGNARDGSQPGASHLAIAAEQRKTNSLTAMPDAGFIS